MLRSELDLLKSEAEVEQHGPNLNLQQRKVLLLKRDRYKLTQTLSDTPQPECLRADFLEDGVALKLVNMLLPLFWTAQVA